MTDLTPAVRSDLAPTGKLRAAINYGNFILATKDTATGESRGVAIDLAHEIARGLGAPVEIVAYDSVAVMGDAAPTGAWDIAFLRTGVCSCRSRCGLQPRRFSTQSAPAESSQPRVQPPCPQCGAD